MEKEFEESNLSLSNYSYWLGTIPYTPTIIDTNNWFKEITRFKHPNPLCNKDCNIGFGITLDAGVVTNELVTRLIEKFQDYIWVREHGFFTVYSLY